jgi:hypothetical protein
MAENHTRGESHGCIVCGKPYDLYVVYDPRGRIIGSKVMSSGGKPVVHARRALVACEHHSQEEIERAIARAYPTQFPEEDE